MHLQSSDNLNSTAVNNTQHNDRLVNQCSTVEVMRHRRQLQMAESAQGSDIACGMLRRKG